MIVRFEHTPPRGVKFHEYADLFPWLEGPALDALREDIRANGIREPVVFLHDAILDGRNRYMCARDLGIEYPRREFGSDPLDGTDPLAFVISLNLTRRHLSEGQRASVAAKLANLGHGGDRKSDQSANLPLDLTPAEPEPAPVTVARAAEMLNVSERSVKSARKVQDKGAPELVAALDAGKVAVSTAADIAELPKAEQVEVVARGEKEILAAAKAIRTAKASVRREERLDNLAEIAKGNTPLSVGVRYPVIYADPPWRYENPPIGASSRSIENHYPTMTLEEICALPVGEMATDDAILYLWATAPKLLECFEVIRAWGFEYRTNMVWDKVNIGMGYHARNQHELLLICKRGEIPPPAAGTQPSSVYREARTAHSAKPAFFAEMIEAAYPQLPKIELFCRSPRDGWAAWGNQSGAAA
jgi:N6-adenosine-specific RNA methylase IME4